MFYYLSFLRPPPVETSLSVPVSVTPQIANDLRTELLYEPQDIFYAWSPVHPQASTPDKLLTTRPVKLTEWKPNSAYKELSIPPPPGVREGQPWRLLLTAQPQHQPFIVQLSNNAEVGKAPFPVLSMPILFSSKGTKGKSASVRKQERIERIYQFPSQSVEEQARLFLTEQTSFDLDKKIWDSGIGLSSWLADIFDNDAFASATPSVLRMKEALVTSDSILELGAGTGIVSLVLGALRPAHESCDALCSHILTTDLPSAIPLLLENIASNACLCSSSCNQPKALVLDWDDESLPGELAQATEIGVIVMADVTYNTSSFPSLIRTLRSILDLALSQSRSPLILLGYKERDSEERSLWDMARKIGIDFEKVAEKRGAGGAPVEVWIGTVCRG